LLSTHLLVFLQINFWGEKLIQLKINYLQNSTHDTFLHESFPFLQCTTKDFGLTSCGGIMHEMNIIRHEKFIAKSDHDQTFTKNFKCWFI